MYIMRNPEKYPYSNRFLGLAERTQEAIGHSRLGRAAISLTNGSRSPMYYQLDWFSKNVASEIRSTVTLQADPNAGLLPRRWRNASVIAMRDIELLELDISPRQSVKEAVAYTTEGVLHVGTRPDRKRLFRDLNEDEFAVAMRLAPGPVDATMGLWIPEERKFTGVKNVRTVEPSVHIDELPTQYPGVLLT